jgi:hypothetical protein
MNDLITAYTYAEYILKEPQVVTGNADRVFSLNGMAATIKMRG